MSTRTNTLPTKTPSYYQIGIYFPDGKKLIKKRCTLNEVFETYFIKLDKHINKYEPEEIIDLYNKTYSDKNIKVLINYVDSWGHTWAGKEAWPKKEWFINYLEKIKND